MLHLSRAQVIRDIEFLVTDPKGRLGRHEWSVFGVDCRRDRHSYNAPLYSFDLDILHVREAGRSERRWELFIVTEHWHAADGSSMHSPKWLKLVSGKSSDVLKWISANRDRNS